MVDLFIKAVPVPRLKYKKHKPVPRTKKLTHSAINVSIEDIDKFEEKEMMQKRPFARKTCNDFLVHRIPKHIIKHWVVLRKKLLVFLKQKQMNIIINVKKSQKKQKYTRKKVRRQYNKICKRSYSRFKRKRSNQRKNDRTY